MSMMEINDVSGKAERLRDCLREEIEIAEKDHEESVAGAPSDFLQALTLAFAHAQQIVEIVEFCKNEHLVAKQSA